MNLYNLKYFADTARLGSMTKAADLNNLSRPAVSQAIRNLEGELEVRLLVHQRRTIELTPTGRLLLKKSEALFEQVDEVVRSLKSESEPLIGEFVIGSARTLATFNLSVVLAKMRKTFPRVSFKVIMANSETLMDKLFNREIDLAYFLGDESLSGFKQVVVRKGSFCLIRPKSLETLDAEFAVTERRAETERLRTLFEREFSKELPVFAEVQSWDAIWSWVTSGVCGGLVPDFMLGAKSEHLKNIAVVLPKVFPYEIKAVFHKAKTNQQIVKSFVESF